jgi:hypothetical protein
MLYTSSLLATVGSVNDLTSDRIQSPRSVVLLNMAKQDVICKLTFVSTVLNVHLNRNFMVRECVCVCVPIYMHEKFMYLHHIDVLNPLCTITPGGVSEGEDLCSGPCVHESGVKLSHSKWIHGHWTLGPP